VREEANHAENEIRQQALHGWQCLTCYMDWRFRQG
jgi:hypothetical protein